MGRTRANIGTPDEDPKKNLTAAAIPLEIKGINSLLYNSQVIDYLTNNIQGSSTALAWSYWSQVPELRYTTRYIANALSVATLYIGEVDCAGGPPKRLPKEHPACELLAAFAGGYAGQAELLDRLGLHLIVAGDSVLIGPVNGEGEPPFDQWRVYSTEEVHARNGQIYLRMPSNSKELQIPDYALAIRIWRPHPVIYWDADSPVKGSLSVLQEFVLLDQHVHASAISRLAGAGFLGIPEELDLPVPDVEIEGTEVDRFVALLTEVMGTAIKNRSSASAMVPIILRGPAEFIDKIKHFDFATEFSGQVPELRQGAIRRLALGMDVPPEILLGSGSSTSWSAWQTDESTLRVHLIPLLQLIASSLTVGWLRPALESLPLSVKQKEQIPNLVVHYDVSNLKIRQDVTGDAQAMYDRLEIDADSLRIATGYGADNAPDNEELARQILLSWVRGSTPELVQLAAKALKENFGLTLLPDAPEPPEAAAPEGAPPSANPSQETTEQSGPLPGERSQDKQTSSPPIPLIGDNSNNGPTP